MKFVPATTSTITIALSREVTQELDQFDAVFSLAQNFFNRNMRIAGIHGRPSFLQCLRLAASSLQFDPNRPGSYSAFAEEVERIKRSHPYSTDMDKKLRVQTTQAKAFYDLLVNGRFIQMIWMKMQQVEPRLVNAVMERYQVSKETASDIVGDAINSFMTLNRSGEDNSLKTGGSVLTALVNLDLSKKSPNEILTKYFPTLLLNNNVLTEIKKRAEEKNIASTEEEMPGADGVTVGDTVQDSNNGVEDLMQIDPDEALRWAKEAFGVQMEQERQKLNDLPLTSLEHKQQRQRVISIETKYEKPLAAAIQLREDMRNLEEQMALQPEDDRLQTLYDQKHKEFMMRIMSIQTSSEDVGALESRQLEQEENMLGVEHQERKIQEQAMINASEAKRMSLPFKWPKDVVVPDASTLLAYGLSPLDPQVQVQVKPSVAPKIPGVAPKAMPKRREPSTTVLDKVRQKDDQLGAQLERRRKLLPHFPRSWSYSGPKRQQLNQKSRLYSPVKWLHEPFQSEDQINNFYRPEDDDNLTQKQLEFLWVRLALEAGSEAAETYIYNRRNQTGNLGKAKGVSLRGENNEGEAGEKAGGSVEFNLFLKMVRDNPIYQVNPEFFENKLTDALGEVGKPGTGRNYQNFSNYLDIYLRAAAYEYGRMTYGGGKDWGELNSRERDLMAYYVWDTFYGDKNRKFQSFGAEDSGPNLIPKPLSDSTHEHDYLKRIRSEIERICNGDRDKNWVSRSAPDQRSNKGHSTNRGEERNVMMPTEPGDHTGYHGGYASGLWNEGGEVSIPDDYLAEIDPRFKQGLLDQVQDDFSVAPEPNDVVAYSIRLLTKIASSFDRSGDFENADRVHRVLRMRIASR